jgi:hypothetical protein
MGLNLRVADPSLFSEGSEGLVSPSLVDCGLIRRPERSRQ